MQTTYTKTFRQRLNSSADHWRVVRASQDLLFHHTPIAWEASPWILVPFFPKSWCTIDAYAEPSMIDSLLNPGGRSVTIPVSLENLVRTMMLPAPLVILKWRVLISSHHGRL